MEDLYGFLVTTVIWRQDVIVWKEIPFLYNMVDDLGNGLSGEEVMDMEEHDLSCLD